MAAYFAVAMVVALDHGHYLSMPFLALFLCGFGYVGWVSLWQGGIGMAVRGAFRRRERGGVAVVPPPAYPILRSNDSDVLVSELGVADGRLSAPEQSA
jgi:hypothetical protein